MSTRPIAQINTLIAAIRNSAAITSYCTTNLGAAFSYFIGIDDGKMPPDSALPLIDFRVGGYSADPDRASRTVGINMAICISKSGTTVSGTTTTMNGLQAMEDLYFLIESVLEGIFGNSSWKYQATYNNQLTEAATPLYRLSWSLILQGEY